MKIAIPSTCYCIRRFDGNVTRPPCWPLTARRGGSGARTSRPATISGFRRYRADYRINANATNVEDGKLSEVLAEDQAEVEKFSQIRLSLQRKMETLEVVAPTTLTAATSEAHDVAPDRIYTPGELLQRDAAVCRPQVRVIVFLNLAPGSRVVYELRHCKTPRISPDIRPVGDVPAFSISSTTPSDPQAPAKLPMHYLTRGVEGGDKFPQIRNGPSSLALALFARSAPMKSAKLGSGQLDLPARPSWRARLTASGRSWPRPYQLECRCGGEGDAGHPGTGRQHRHRPSSDRREQAEALYR